MLKNILNTPTNISICNYKCIYSIYRNAKCEHNKCTNVLSNTFNSNEMFVKSKWYESPTAFNYWKNIINYNDPTILKYIIDTFPLKDKYLSEFTGVCINMMDVDDEYIEFICDIINAININVNTIIPSECEYKSDTTFALEYILLILIYDTDKDVDILDKSYFAGLETLKKYININKKYNIRNSIMNIIEYIDYMIKNPNISKIYKVRFYKAHAILTN